MEYKTKEKKQGFEKKWINSGQLKPNYILILIDINL